MRTFLIWGSLISLSFLSSSAAAETRLVITSQENGVQSQPELDCNGVVHGYIVLPKRYQGAHTLEGVWTSPSGKVLAHSHDEVRFEPPGRSTAHVWFSFPERNSLPLSPLTPQADEERLSYPGLWHLQVVWDGARLTESSFKVRCF